ncbi:hypothetical protein BG004_001179 [Podila humilis]|nr:hypothetical protein BG004_001179 [Podila humilis]
MAPSPLQAYVSRMKGQRYDPSKLSSPAPPPPSRITILVSTFIGSFIGIAIVASLSYNAQWFVERDVPVLSGAFGASAVLIYGAIEAPLSQPRNVIIGHLVSSVIGVSLFKLFNLLSAELFLKLHWLLCALAVSISLCFMQLTHTVHPPASATALIAVTGGETIYNLGYWYCLCPVALGISLMMIVAVLVNNVARKYPTHWWNPKTRMITVVDQDMSTTLADFVSTHSDSNSNNDSTCESDAGDEVCCREDGFEELNNQDTTTSSSSGLSTKTPSMVHESGVTTSSSVAASAIPTHKRTSLTGGDLHHSHIHYNHQHQHNRHRNNQPQYAIYYGGENSEVLRDGEQMHEEHRRRPSTSNANDVEKGHAHHHHHVHHAHDNDTVTIETRGSTRPSPSQRAASTFSSTREEEYRATIESLRQRIREMETQAANSE